MVQPFAYTQWSRHLSALCCLVELRLVYVAIFVAIARGIILLI